jgi:hypothetical protein
MGGSPTTTQNTQQQSITNPWAPAAPILSGILGQLGGAVTNAGVSPDEAVQRVGKDVPKRWALI